MKFAWERSHLKKEIDEPCDSDKFCDRKSQPISTQILRWGHRTCAWHTILLRGECHGRDSDEVEIVGLNRNDTVMATHPYIKGSSIWWDATQSWNSGFPNTLECWNEPKIHVISYITREIQTAIVGIMINTLHCKPNGQNQEGTTKLPTILEILDTPLIEPGHLKYAAPRFSIAGYLLASAIDMSTGQQLKREDGNEVS